MHTITVAIIKDFSYRLRSAPTEIFKTFRGCLCKKDIDKYKVYVTLLPQQLVHCRRMCFAASGQY